MSVVVLGAGATGEAFVGALRRLDDEIPIALVEHELVGGECSYWACIPSKTLLRPVEMLYRGRHVPGIAERLEGVEVARIFEWRDEVAAKDDASQADWVRERGAEVVRGTAEITAPGSVRVGERELSYDDLVVATGSEPMIPPVQGLAEAGYWTNREATSASEVPASLVIVGGGAVGCELAQFYARIGSRVTLVQSGDYLLPRIDREAGDLLADVLREEDVDVRLNERTQAVEGGADRLRVLLEGGDELNASALLVATGRTPRVEGFGLEKLDVTIERSGLVVDDRLRAGPGVWAAGDVTGVALFTHVGKYQGRVAAANVAGGDVRANYDAIPAAIFTDPQIATVGDLSGDGAVTAKWSLESVSRAGTYYKPKRPGFVKLYADPKRGVLVGGLVVGPEAGEWIGQLTLAVRGGVPVDVLRDTIQPFPTFAEAIFFAARDLPL